MRFIVDAMPYRRLEIAGFVPADARAMHGAGTAVPYIAEGEEAPEVEDTGYRASTTPESEAEIARLNAIENLTPAILAEHHLAQIAMGKRIRNLDNKAKLSLDDAVAAIAGELERRQRAAEAAETPPGVLSTGSAGATMQQAHA